MLTSASIPLPIPIGLYVTNLIIGGVFGRLVGEILLVAGLNVEPGSIAMISAAAYVGAVTHTFSSGVLILELTGEMDYCLHVLLATSIAVTFSRTLSDSIFKKIIDMRSLPFIDEMLYIPKPVLAKDIMSRDIRPINKRVTQHALRSFLQHEVRSKSSAFVYPVVVQREDESAQFVGTITKEALLQTLADADEEGNGTNKKINLAYKRPSFSVLDDTPLEQVHMFFITGHLRFVFVSHNGIPVGIITREDVGNALKHQHVLA